MPSLDHELPDPPAQDPQLRQWLAFPDTPATVKLNRLAPFYVLLEDDRGYLSFVATRSRTPPDPGAMIEFLAASGWPTRTPWRNPYMEPHGPVLLMDADIEALPSWPLEATAADAFGAALATHAPTLAADAAALRDELRARLSAELQNGFDTFVERLDTEAVRVARAAGGLTVARYNYLVGGDERKRRNRLQAVKRYPILADQLATDEGYKLVRKAIDQGEPLLDCLASHFEVQRAVIRRVASTPLEWIDAQWRKRPHVLMRLLSDLEPSTRPATQEQWVQFDRAVALIAKTSGHPSATTSNRLWLRQSASGGFRRTNLPTADLAATAAVIDAFSAGLVEALREDFLDLVKAPQAERLARHALATVQQGLGVERMAAVAAKWLVAWRGEQEAAESEMQLATGERWPNLLPESLTIGDMQVVELTTPIALRGEAARMSNCLDTYVQACAQGECQIFSVRSEDGASHSAIETQVKRALGGAFSVVVVQHAGVRNSKPPAACARVVPVLVRALSGATAQLEAFWRWRTQVARLRRTDRVALARTAAARRALERVLPKRVGYRVLLEAGVAQHPVPH